MTTAGGPVALITRSSTPFASGLESAVVPFLNDFCIFPLQT